MSYNDNIIQSEIARSNHGQLLGVPPTIVEPPSPALPPYYRQSVPPGSKPLIRQSFELSNNGRKEFLHLTPLNTNAVGYGENAITSLAGLSSYQFVAINPYQQGANPSYPSGAVALVPIEDFPYSTFKEDSPILPNGGAGGNFPPQTWIWTPDSTRYLYKVILNIPIVLWVSAYSSGTWNLNNLTLTMINSQTKQNIIPPINVSLGGAFTGLTSTGALVAMVRAVINTPVKIVFGQSIQILISLTKTSGSGGTAYHGIPEIWPDIQANATKKWYPTGIFIHSYATPDHIDNLTNDALYQQKYNYDGVQQGQ